MKFACALSLTQDKGIVLTHVMVKGKTGVTYKWFEIQRFTPRSTMLDCLWISVLCHFWRRHHHFLEDFFEDVSHVRQFPDTLTSIVQIGLTLQEVMMKCLDFHFFETSIYSIIYIYIHIIYYIWIIRLFWNPPPHFQHFSLLQVSFRFLAHTKTRDVKLQGERVRWRTQFGCHMFFDGWNPVSTHQLRLVVVSCYL